MQQSLQEDLDIQTKQRNVFLDLEIFELQSF